MTSPRAPALRIEQLAKAFGATQALAGVSLEVEKGNVHALLGANGCGKSTLIKILAGVVEADAGALDVAGNRHDARAITPALARHLGLRFVHQQPTTFADLSVAENLAIGRGFETGRAGRVRWRAQRACAAATLARFRIDADPSQRLGSLAPARQTMVAIARALQDQTDGAERILILDEPTGSLPASEVDLLLNALRTYASEGQTILYVSHRLEEILRVADVATVLRDGRVVATTARSGLTHDALVHLILGRALEQAAPRVAATRHERIVLQVRGLRGGAIRDASFSLRAGEILGVAGLLGSGRSTLLRLLFGATACEDGEVRLDGEPLSLRAPAEAIAAGVAYVPEDRPREAAFGDLSVKDNLSIAGLGDYWRGGRLRHASERADARAQMERYSVRAESEQVPLNSLSGGNQQKVMLARWMRATLRVLLLDEPTQGVDVGARAEIYGLIREAVAAGSAVLLVSSDVEELAMLCDRSLILRRGRVTGQLEVPEVTGTRLNHLLLETEAVPA